jgi:hypothetical protein
MKKTTFFVLAFALLATACNSSGTVSPTVVSTPTEIPSATPLPSATPIPSATPTATPNLPFVSKCPDVVSEMPSNANGVIALNGNYLAYNDDLKYYVVNDNPSYLWDIKTGIKTSLIRDDDENLKSFTVSPDHRLFAYFAEHGTSRTIIAKADGQLLRIITGKRWFSNYGWSEDNWLCQIS